MAAVSVCGMSASGCAGSRTPWFLASATTPTISNEGSSTGDSRRVASPFSSTRRPMGSSGPK